MRRNERYLYIIKQQQTNERAANETYSEKSFSRATNLVNLLLSL